MRNFIIKGCNFKKSDWMKCYVHFLSGLCPRFIDCLERARFGTLVTQRSHTIVATQKFSNGLLNIFLMWSENKMLLTFDLHSVESFLGKWCLLYLNTKGCMFERNNNMFLRSIPIRSFTRSNKIEPFEKRLSYRTFVCWNKSTAFIFQNYAIYI